MNTAPNAPHRGQSKLCQFNLCRISVSPHTIGAAPSVSRRHPVSIAATANKERVHREVAARDMNHTQTRFLCIRLLLPERHPLAWSHCHFRRFGSICVGAQCRSNKKTTSFNHSISSWRPDNNWGSVQRVQRAQSVPRTKHLEKSISVRKLCCARNGVCG